MSVDSPPGLNLPALRKYLADTLTDFDPDGALVPTLMAGGRSNVTYQLSQGERSWVLRRPPLGHVMPSAHDMGREFRVLAGLDKAGFPVPAPLLLCDDPTVIGASFMVMEYVAGRVIADATTAARLSAGEAELISRNLVDTLIELHTVDPIACGLGDLGRPEGYLQRQVRRWGQQWQLTKTRELPEIDWLLGWLTVEMDRLPPDLPWTVVHGDFRLDNLILGIDDPGVRAVLDWEMSTLGDPVADLAVTLVYWSEAGDQLRHRIPVAEHVTEVPGFWDRKAIASHYAVQTGRDLGHLDACVALACLKLAVIMESIHMRQVKGQQLGTASAGAEMAGATEALAILGQAVAEGGGVLALGS